MGHLGAILGHFGATMGYLGGYLGAMLGLPGATLPLLSFPPNSVNIFKTCVSCMRNACFRDPPTLAVSRATVGASLGPSWAILKHLEATLEPSWAILGPY